MTLPKMLTEAEWKSFAKDEKLDEKGASKDTKALHEAVREALQELQDLDKAKPTHGEMLAGLKELEDLLTKQVAANAKRKDAAGKAIKDTSGVKNQLYKMMSAVEAHRKDLIKDEEKAAEAKAAEAKSKGKGKDDEDDEADTPALLNTKMIPLLRELRKGQMQMHAVICTAGKNTAVLIMRRPISKSRYPLLAEAVDAKGGMKYIVADCLFELQNKLLTFVVKSPGAQLAKRVRQALLDQTQLRFRVKVRGDDGVEEHDGEDEGDDQAGVKAQAQKAPPGGPASAEQLAYTQRLLKVRERYEQALKEQHPESTKLRALMGLASKKANEEKDYTAAIQALQALEELLTAGTSAPTGGVDPAVAFKARLTALLPRMKEAIAASGPAAQDVKLKASEAGVFATKKNFDQANRLLDEVEELMGGGAKPAPSVPGSRFSAVEARYLAALKTQPANASELRAAMDAMNDALDKGDMARAETVLTRLTKLLDDAGSLGKETDVIRKGLVEEMRASFEKAQARWESGVAQARASMKPIQAGLTGPFAAAAPAIDNILDNYRQDLAGLLAEAQAVKDEPAVDSAVKQLRAKVQTLRAEIAAEQLFVYLDKNGAPISPAFTVALDDIGALIGG